MNGLLGMRSSLVIVGTRPEAIKLAPLIHELHSRGLPYVTLLTGQHEPSDLRTTMLSIVPDADGSFRYLGSTSSVGMLSDGIARLLEDETELDVVVQGDTRSAFAGALAGFMARRSVIHVEAGLRTGNLSGPFPEEGFRQMISRISTHHMAPSEQAAMRLVDERVAWQSRVFATGNTGLDALRLMVDRAEKCSIDRDLVIVTLHRRESWGSPMIAALQSLRSIALRRPDFRIWFVLHPNPRLAQTVDRELGDLSNVMVLPPRSYSEMVHLLLKCAVLITDSGGLQEEAYALGTPTLILRDDTERPEVLKGKAHLCGGDGRLLNPRFDELLCNVAPTPHRQFSETDIGDGWASKRIVDILEAEAVSA